MDSTIIDIKVTESPILVMDSVDDKWKTVPEFNITVITDQYIHYIVRYIPDLQSFDQLVRTHYQKIKIPFPTLTENKKLDDKKRTIRHFFHLPVKSDADKVEKYLLRCSVDPILKSSTLLRDFFSPQREGDIKKSLTSSSSDLMPTTILTTTNTTTMAEKSESAIREKVADYPIKVWEPMLNPSIISQSSHESSLHQQPANLSTFPLDNLEMIKVLGRGCMGKVMLVRSKKTMELYALKSIVKQHVIEQREITHTIDERNILVALSEINHPYLAKLHTAFQDEHRLYLLTNYYSGGDLATHMARLYTFPKESALFYAAEIIDGIGELHRLGILYRDLKPENILFTGDGHIILTDFGLSKWLDKDDPQTHTFCGTAEYLAPEVLLGEPYSFGIDYWSFGTILYEMLAGVTPFWADNHADMYRRVLEDPLEFPSDIFDYETAEFISDLLDRDPNMRLGAQGVDEIKDHVYFADISWDDIRQRKLQPPLALISPVKEEELDFTNFDPDFLAMPPSLTPVSSEMDLTEEIQDIFDDYSFIDNEYEQAHRTVVVHNIPARKRGSISMLSDSICLNESKKDEEARCAKRRNTNTFEDHQMTTLDVDKEVPIIPKITDSSAFEFSNLPDLRLSFDLKQHNTSTTTTANNSTKSRKSKAKKFFSLLL
ncbi:hypothetical protein G6F70_005459 [Rhizopus microsporus]|uniref:Kinase-like protein n=1 Tax=Rhizopus microsporus TaxID=58291 RepID=A0A1X0RZK4_RHIZD|nr:hypothetical protein G6F71_005694 [Rhizopus microsporus]KAG1198842.1 hypothetical protein G6F70_005459 [Rhizopus microsporus]KAG1210258.1 hypothetical protein G6F69_005645 [Rhizopus microsporus]ORE17493.1 kinase-like protein [Rhizopus microsporus]